MALKVPKKYEIIETPYLTDNVDGSGFPIDLSGWRDGILAPNGKIYCMPHYARTVLVINRNGSTYQFGNLLPRSRPGGIPSPLLSGSVLVGTKIYCCPGSGTEIVVVNTENDSISYIGSFPDDEGTGNNGAWVPEFKFSGIWYNNGLLFMAGLYWAVNKPSTAVKKFPGGMVIVNPSNGEILGEVSWPTGIVSGVYGIGVMRIGDTGILFDDGIIRDIAVQGVDGPFPYNITSFNTNTLIFQNLGSSEIYNNFSWGSSSFNNQTLTTGSPTIFTENLYGWLGNALYTTSFSVGHPYSEIYSPSFTFKNNLYQVRANLEDNVYNISIFDYETLEFRSVVFIPDGDYQVATDFSSYVTSNDGKSIYCIPRDATVTEVSDGVWSNDVKSNYILKIIIEDNTGWKIGSI